MAEEAPTPAAAVAAVPAPAKPAKSAKTGKKKSSAPRKKDAPSLPKLIVDILTDSKERKGMSVTAIKKNLNAKGVDVLKANKRINTTLARLVSKGTAVQVKGTGASGSFKLAKVESEKKVKKEVKKSPVKVRKPVAKKSPAKKPAAKKAAKKPAAKKTPVKKSTPKKTAPKVKPSPKKVAKKQTPKKAPKKVASKKVNKKSEETCSQEVQKVNWTSTSVHQRLF